MHFMYVMLMQHVRDLATRGKESVLLWATVLKCSLRRWIAPSPLSARRWFPAWVPHTPARTARSLRWTPCARSRGSISDPLKRYLNGQKVIILCPPVYKAAGVKTKQDVQQRLQRLDCLLGLYWTGLRVYHSGPDLLCSTVFHFSYFFLFILGRAVD